MDEEKKDGAVLEEVEVTGVSLVKEEHMTSPGQKMVVWDKDFPQHDEMIEDEIEADIIEPDPKPISPEEPPRIKMSDERLSATHKFTLIGGEKILEFDGKKTVEKYLDVEGYITAGAYPDGRLGEVFLTIGKEGAHWKAFECLMIAVSVGLQYGIPLSVFLDKFTHVRFEPSGYTKNPEIPISKSMVDYIFRWLEIKFPDGVNKALAVAAKAEEDAGDGPCRCGKETESGDDGPGGGEAVSLCEDGQGDNGKAPDAAGGPVSGQ